MTLAKFTFKNYGVTLHDLKYRTLPRDLFEYEELMHIHNDYEYANYEDTKPKQRG